MTASEERSEPHPSHASETATTQQVRLAMAGSEDSMAWVAEHFSPLLLLQARFRLRGALRGACQPEDLVNEVWIRALPRLAGLSSRGGRHTTALLRYLTTVLRNRVKDLSAKMPPQSGRSHSGDASEGDHLQEIPGDATGVTTRAVRGEHAHAVLRCLERLSPDDQEIVVLRGLEQLRNKEVAEILGEKPNTIAVRYRRALEALRASLPGSIFDELE